MKNNLGKILTVIIAIVCLYFFPVNMRIVIFSTIWVNLFLLASWLFIASKKRTYSQETSISFAISYICLIVNSVMILIDGNHHLSPLEVSFKFAYMILQLNGTICILWGIYTKKHLGIIEMKRAS